MIENVLNGFLLVFELCSQCGFYQLL